MTLSCGSERAKREMAFEFDLNTSEGFGEEVGTGCISDRGTSIGKGMEI